MTKKIADMCDSFGLKFELHGFGFAACQYAIDRFKQALPTAKRETYQDGSVWTGE